MDSNKVKKMKAVGYTLQPSCGICVYALFRAVTPWGTCTKHQYEHMKHSDANRNMSIHKSGICPDFAISPLGVVELGAYKDEFFDV